MEHKYIEQYPRPQFVRDAWLSLDGAWNFRFDDQRQGKSEQWYKKLPQPQSIIVPFTYETKASGIGDESLHSCIWYERSFKVPETHRNQRIILHFQAVDYKATVWINGVMAGSHEGGYSAFSFDITDNVSFEQENIVTVQVEDHVSRTQPRGKQRWIKDNFGCWYVQTTGIWQSVWLEFVAQAYVEKVRMTPDIDTSSIAFDYYMQGLERYSPHSLQLSVNIWLHGKLVRQFTHAAEEQLSYTYDISSPQAGEWQIALWHPEHPNLYDVEIILRNEDTVLDRVYTYFGMRKISTYQGNILLNNVPIEQRLILDQGYWTDTHLTPPSEQALIDDIDKTLQMGFNGVRKHQKLEDPRYMYWCDRKGVLLWSEMASTYQFNEQAVTAFTKEWLEIVEQHYNHPCIVTWVPFNESWGISNILTNRKQQQFTEGIYHLTKSIDDTRLVIVNDGWEHTISDVITLHDYEESGEEFSARYADKEAVLSNAISFNKHKFALAQGYRYNGQPIMISEYGGIAFNSEQGWGYGNQVSSEQEFIERYHRITQAIKETPYVSGYCYTQITDVQQEVNGLLKENREPKLPLETIKAINLGKYESK
ncbi:glycoside hydrolase family 2 protein [Paenibacillus camelliae]|uniref:glycoside hydrolase family 2 protein n=1 Tax=Paenibacillus camelliae TaxID=512410 RepID=UPI00203BCD90|nr:sugar-binding domain-containing protein [Paenibacillus camelliae]MCM3632838.1 glycoside hydrolase family 2 [Paenibacillus camelliae]